MKNFYTVVLERMRDFTASFNTEPYETGWASEAMFFIRVHDMGENTERLESQVQVSVDGIEWIDEGTHFPTITSAGNYFVRVSHFGGWLRLRNTVVGVNPSLNATIHLALKE